MCAARIRFEKEKFYYTYYIYIYIHIHTRTDLYEHRPLKQFTNCIGKFLEFDNA